ncbi:MAG: AraC family transcriptional regulator [bacterium]
MQPLRYTTGEKIVRADDCQGVSLAAQAKEIDLHCFGRYRYPGERLKKEEVPGVSSCGVWKTISEQHYGLPPHQNEGIKFIMALQGEMPITIEGHSYVIRRNQLMITRPWQIHSLGDPNFSKGKLGWLMFDVGVRHPHQAWVWPKWLLLTKLELKALTNALRYNEDAIRAVTPEFTKTFVDFVELAKTPNMPYRGSQMAVAANALFLHLLAELECHPPVYNQKLTDSVRTIRMFLEKLPSRMKESWSVQLMAEACDIGTTHFTSQFMTLTGDTPAKYLLRLRLNRATELLTTTSLPLKDICEQSGFNRPSYFIEIFTQKYGTTPFQYRKITV